MEKNLTRKERKRLAKGKSLINKKANKKLEYEVVEQKKIIPFNVNNFNNINDTTLLDYIADTRRRAYTEGYFSAKNKSSYVVNDSFFPKYPDKKDKDIFLTIKSISSTNEEDKNTIVKGILSWFYNSCYYQGYSSYLPQVDVQLPIHPIKNN
jgi:hypothetical protein